jgi:O-antigen/teichoic acid export membrane protein
MLAAAIFPVAAAGHVTHMKESILKLSRIVISAYSIVVIVLAVVGKWLFPLVFGESFSSMYSVFLLLIPGLLALTMQALISPFFAAVNRLSVNLLSSLIGLVAIIPLNLWLIPSIGIQGAAIASSASYIAAFLFLFLQFRKVSSVGILEMLFVRTTDFQFLKNILRKL